MSDPWKYTQFLTNVLVISVIAGAGFTIGCAAVCRLIKWAPVNITVNNHNHFDPPTGEENAA